MLRWSRLLLIAVALLALHGCVYVRLFQVKLQCGDFADNFAFAPGPGLTLVFKHPVLLAEDTVTLIGGQPSEITTSATAATADADLHWIFRYRRIHPSNPPAPADVVAIDFGIQAGNIERVSFPPQVFAVIPPDLAKAMMRAMGHAHIDQGARTASTQVDMAPDLAPAPDRNGIDKLFGHPDLVLHQNGIERRLYRYALDPPTAPVVPATSSTAAATAEQPPTPAIIGIVFRDHLPTAQQFQAGVSGLWLYVELPGAAPPPRLPPAGEPKPKLGLGVEETP